MAGERAFPGLGLFGFFNLGTNGWGDRVSDNFRKLSALAQITVQNFAYIPGSAPDGTVYCVQDGGGNFGNIAIRDAGQWIYYSPPAGALLYNQADGQFYYRPGWTGGWNRAFAQEKIGYRKRILRETQTWYKSSGLSHVIITSVGGGGGGGGVGPAGSDDTVGGNGGPGGQAVSLHYAANLPAAVACYIGGGGGGGGGHAAGGPGGATQFGPGYCDANGGGGGQPGNKANGIRVPIHGSPGYATAANLHTAIGAAGNPSMAVYPGSAGPLIPLNKAGQNGDHAGYGSGAGGAGASQHNSSPKNFNGGNGGSGIMIIEEFFS